MSYYAPPPPQNPNTQQNPNPFAEESGILGLDLFEFIAWVQANAIKGLVLIGIFCIALFVVMLLIYMYKSARALRENKKVIEEQWQEEPENIWQPMERYESHGLIKITRDMLSITNSKIGWRMFMVQVALWGIAFSAISLFVFQNWKAAIPLFFLGAAFPYQGLYNKLLRRREIFLRQFLPTMTAFTSVYQNTKNRARTIILVKDRLPPEMRTEFNLMANKLNSSIPLSECLETFAKRISNKWGYAFATVMSIPDKVGGDIEDALISLTDKIAAEQISVGESKSSLAYVKGTFNVLLILQVVAAAISFGAFPESYRVFAETAIGQTAFFFIAMCNLISMIVVSMINYRR